VNLIEATRGSGAPLVGESNFRQIKMAATKIFEYIRPPIASIIHEGQSVALVLDLSRDKEVSMDDSPQRIFDWSTEYILVGIGVLAGIIYVLEAWKAPEKKTSIINSPRFAELKWVLLGAGIAIAGDFKSAGISPHKDHLITGYLIGAVASIIGMLVFTSGFVWAQSFVWSRKDPHAYPSPPFSPVLDYLNKGYDYYRQTYTEGSRAKSRDFLQSYVDQLTYAIGAINAYRTNPTAALGPTVAKELLRSVKAVVALYRPDTDGSGINANYMIAYPAKDLPPDKAHDIRFAFGDLARYEYFLALEAYADDKDLQHFALPVEPRVDSLSYSRLLPGAPTAFFDRKRALESDTSVIRYRKGIPPEAISEMKRYFADRTFRSFASLVIIGQGGRRLGVVNVDSDDVEVFGHEKADQDVIESLLRPFVTLLSFVIER
jgi:hypothetical protein